MLRTRLGRRLFWWVLLPAIALTLALAIFTAYVLRPSHINAVAVAGLKQHLNLDVTIGHISVTLFPQPRIDASGIVLRLPNRPELPPFVEIDKFWAGAGPFSVLRKHVNTVHLAGLRIAMPPGEARREIARGNGSDSTGAISDVIIEHLIATDAVLMFVPRNKDKTPLTFEIHNLDVEEVGFTRRMPFKARLVNPVPKGLVEANGSVGPWNKDDLTRTPLEGAYVFTDADLSTINGIGGILTSRGSFDGELTAIAVTGDAQVPDFSLDLGGQPIPLTAKFDTTVDGTDGTTTLNKVEAQIADTPMLVSGAITNLAGPGRHQVDLDVRIDDGRIEDLVRLSIDSPEPLMTGDVQLQASLSLPPGPTRVRNRLRLSGRFGLGSARFTDAQVQDRLQEFSRRGQGKSKEDPMARVMTSLRGQFTLANGTLGLPDLTFRVPGAAVLLRGNYGLARGDLDFVGTLRLQASASRAIGGFRSIFIRPFDPLFRKDGAGAVVPIRITGTREAPKFSVQFGKIFSGD